jgi:hypothetical protein
MLTSRDIYKMVEIETNVNLITNSRERKYVYARGIANTLCKEFTLETFEAIGAISGLDHSSIMNSIKAFENTYIHYSAFHREAYMKLQEILLAIKKQEAIDAKTDKKKEKEPPKSLEHLRLTYKYLALKNQNLLLSYQVRKKKEEYYKELFAGNPLVVLVDRIPPEKMEIAKLRIEAIIKML